MVKRGSVFGSFEIIRRMRPSTGCELTEAGREISNRSLESPAVAPEIAIGRLMNVSANRSNEGTDFNLVAAAARPCADRRVIRATNRISTSALSSHLRMDKLHGPAL